jgi:serine phosphatase RsbU (regulator of sigma subunit)
VDFIADISDYRSSTALQKEKKAGDTLSEMAENLKRAQMTLVTSSPPLWPHVEIGSAGHQGISISGIYYDFFDIPDGAYGIIMGEASSKGAEGVIYTAVLRGMVRSLCRLTTKPVELITILNDIIFRDSMSQVFTLTYLTLNSQTNELHYISCGQGNLWQIKANETTPQKISISNPRLGEAVTTEFSEITQPWNIGDTLILNTFATPSATSSAEFSDELFEQALQENIGRPPQKQVEGILRKVRVSANKLLRERSISLVSIHRKQ